VGDLHWADGYPFCTRLYTVLLGAGFYGPKDGAMVAELEDVLEVLLKVWPVLGITPMVHRTVFGWLFTRQHFACGETNPRLLVASDHQVRNSVLPSLKRPCGLSLACLPSSCIIFNVPVCCHSLFSGCVMR